MSGVNVACVYQQADKPCLSLPCPYMSLYIGCLGSPSAAMRKVGPAVMPFTSFNSRLCPCMPLIGSSCNMEQENATSKQWCMSNIHVMMAHELSCLCWAHSWLVPSSLCSACRLFMICTSCTSTPWETRTMHVRLRPSWTLSAACLLVVWYHNQTVPAVS